MSQPELEELIENFALFDDWEERYKYLIELGKNLSPMDDGLKTEETLVRGCTSRVWLFGERQKGCCGQENYYFIADSDAHIVRGLVAVVLIAFQGKTAEEIQSIDIEQSFKEIGLDQHLSPNRRNGFFSMVERVRVLTQEERGSL